MAGLLIISMSACGSGGAAGGSKPAEEVKSEDLSKDSKGFGESPALENTDDRYMPEITEVDIDGKIYKTKAISLQKPIYGNYVRNFLVQGEKFYLNIAGSDPGTIAEDGFYSFVRQGDVLAEQKQEELGSYSGLSLEHPSIDNQGNIYYVNWKDIVKWTPQGFIKALGLPQKGAFAVNPDGSSGIFQRDAKNQPLMLGRELDQHVDGNGVHNSQQNNFHQRAEHGIWCLPFLWLLCRRLRRCSP